jgi:tetratricopeptide (TPR) repeat protein
VLSALTLAAFLVLRDGRPADPRRLREQAAAAVKAQRYKEAEAVLGQLPSKRPMDWVLQSKVDLGLGRPETALLDLAKVPDSDRLGALARYMEGVILLNDLHRALSAEAALRRAVALAPTAVPARQTLCYLYYTLSMKAEFAAQFAVLEAAGAVIFDDVYHACVVMRGGTETQQIVERLKAFLEADPADRRSRLALAEELTRLNRLAEAEQVLSVLPTSDSRAQALCVQMALERGDVRTAQTILAAGPDRDPDLAPQRGKLALARGDLQTASHEFLIAVTAYPDHRDAVLGLGRALRLAGDRRAAEPYIQAVAERDRLALLLQDLAAPGATHDPRRLHKLGMVCETLHRYPEARAWYRLALASDPSAINTREALDRVAHHQQSQY